MKNLTYYLFSALILFFIASCGSEKAKEEVAEEYVENLLENASGNKVKIDIDKNGNLISANLTSKEHMSFEKKEIIDSIYNLNKPKNIEIRKAKTNFEKDILKIVKKLNLWEKTFIQRTETSVRIRKFMQFYKKPNEIKVYY